MSTVPKIQNRRMGLYVFDAAQINREMEDAQRIRYEFQHIVEKRRAERIALFKDFATLLAMVGLLALVYWVA